MSNRSPDTESPEKIHTDDDFDPIYHAKAEVLNKAIQDIGMGRYQWGLFFVTGFGWLADNIWPTATGLILPPVLNEFKFQGPYLTLGQSVGLLIGAAFWGVGADIWGRKISFNLTLLITGVFGMAGGGSRNHIALTSFATMWSIGAGGNLPVDSAIFLEFVPGSHQYLLTVLSIWWAFGQLFACLIAWPLIGNYSCPINSPCPRSSNQGWRYFLFAMGAFMLILWVIRFFFFKLSESPKYLMGRGHDKDAVEVIHKVAKYNGKVSEFTLEELQGVEKIGSGNEGRKIETTVKAALQRKIINFDGNHVKPLFATRKLAWSTSLLIIIWALIGLAYTLYYSFITYYFASRGAHFGDGSVYITYRNQVILAICGIPGSLLAGYMVEIRLLGRRGTLSISTILTGIFILASTTARGSNSLLGWNCASSFSSTVMYGVLYAMTPELFPTKHRGTGNALTATATGVFGVMAPVIALFANLTTSVPIFIAGVVFLGAGVLTLLLPFESLGKASL